MNKVAVLTKTHKDFHEFVEHLPGYIKCTNIEFINIIKYGSTLLGNEIDFYLKTDTKPTNNKLILSYMEEHNINEINVKKLTDIF